MLKLSRRGLMTTLVGILAISGAVPERAWTAPAKPRGQKQGNSLVLPLHWPQRAQACPRYAKAWLSASSGIERIDLRNPQGEIIRIFELKPRTPISPGIHGDFSDLLAQLDDSRELATPLEPPLSAASVASLALHLASGQTLPPKDYELTMTLTCDGADPLSLIWNCEQGRCEPEVAQAAPRPQPVGGQFLAEDQWEHRLPHVSRIAPPVYFLISQAELSGHRYGGDLNWLGFSLAEEALAVLDEGCKTGCGDAQAAARKHLKGFIDERDGRLGAIQTRRRRGDDESEEIRTIEFLLSSRSIPVALRVSCTCNTSYYGMRRWDDVTECSAMLLHRGQLLFRYEPRIVLRRDKKHIDLHPLQQYQQTLIFGKGKGDTLEILSGYEFSGDGGERRIKKGAVLGSIRFTGGLARFARP